MATGRMNTCCNKSYIKEQGFMVNHFTIASIIRIETVVPLDASQRGAEGFA